MEIKIPRMRNVETADLLSEIERNNLHALAA